MTKDAITFELLTAENLEKARSIDRDDIGEDFCDTLDTIMEYTQYGLEHHCQGHTWLIRHEEICLGIILMGEAFPWSTDPPQMQQAPFYRLMGFVMDRRYRGRGLGGFILEKAIEACYREYGVRPIALGCHKDNIQAARFYQRHGFEKTEYMENEDYYYLRYPNKG